MYLHQLIIVLMVFVIRDFGLKSLGLRPKVLDKLFCELGDFLDLQSS